jgi:Holliday junction resolvase-like predicted endonuclease
MEQYSQNKILIGQNGQSRVVEHFLARGFHIVAQNIRAGRGEVDLIVAPTPGIWWCVEVKTRTRVLLVAQRYFNKKRFVMARTLARWISSFLGPRPSEIFFVLAVVVEDEVELFDL